MNTCTRGIGKKTKTKTFYNKVRTSKREPLRPGKGISHYETKNLKHEFSFFQNTDFICISTFCETLSLSEISIVIEKSTELKLRQRIYTFGFAI